MGRMPGSLPARDLRSPKVSALGELSPRVPREVRDIERLARWLDSRFSIPGTNIRFGFDSLLGLIPGAGDALTSLLGVYIVARAHALGVPAFLLVRMIWNLLLDAVLGAVPVLGDVFDVAFKANLKNLGLLLDHLDRTP